MNFDFKNQISFSCILFFTNKDRLVKKKRIIKYFSIPLPRDPIQSPPRRLSDEQRHPVLAHASHI